MLVWGDLPPPNCRLAVATLSISQDTPYSDNEIHVLVSSETITENQINRENISFWHVLTNFPLLNEPIHFKKISLTFFSGCHTEQQTIFHLHPCNLESNAFSLNLWLPFFLEGYRWYAPALKCPRFLAMGMLISSKKSVSTALCTGRKIWYKARNIERHTWNF